ncbi:hypothetical protein [Natronorubrum sp. DTA7]|uniref:hypothetical protein n=1 Tax=Natronorubrum sp. DTA7 TaxID=3447016 RepID=UPI003F824853
MSLDRHAAERRRFARLLGIDGELGSGLPIGSHSSGTVEKGHDRNHRDDTDRARSADQLER